MTYAAQSHFDSARAQGFAERLLRALNDAALCLMVSIGHRSGLFDIMSRMPPATANDIAVEAGLHERYVREWLGAMVTAGVAEYNALRKATSRGSPPIITPIRVVTFA